MTGGQFDGLWAGDLSGNWSLLIEPSPGALDSVTVTVVDIKDYH